VENKKIIGITRGAFGNLKRKKIVQFGQTLYIHMTTNQINTLKTL
jgi:hypothetical protein